jgi:HEPN domain-containing protein
MTNPDLARDYFTRAQKRLKAIAVLLEEEAFADVVRESQEVVELLLKAVLRHFGITVPFSHEPSQSFVENAERLPEPLRGMIPRWAEISRKLRRDRELAFYGSEDVTPSTFYKRKDAEEAKAMAEEILSGAAPLLRPAPPASGEGADREGGAATAKDGPRGDEDAD